MRRLPTKCDCLRSNQLKSTDLRPISAIYSEGKAMNDTARRRLRASRQHGRYTAPKHHPTRAEGRRGKFPSTWIRSKGTSHGTQRILDKGGRRRQNRKILARDMRAGRKTRVALLALAKELAE